MWKFLFDKKWSGQSGWIWVGKCFVCLLITGLIAALSWFEKPPVSTLDHFFQDTFIRFRAMKNKSAEIQYTALVDIDDDSLLNVGQWPWPRYRIGNLLRILSKNDLETSYTPPAAIALDILFSEKDRSSLATIQESFQKEFGLDLSFKGLPPGMEDNDGYLGSIISSTKAIGSCFLFFDMQQRENKEYGLLPLQITGEKKSIHPPLAYGILYNTPRVQQGIRYSGYINALLDNDGFLRSLPLFIEYNGNWYPSLSLAALMHAERVEGIHIETDMFGPVVIVGEARIPVDETGRAVISFLGPQGTIPTVSAVQVLSGEADLSMLSERIVFIGSSAVGLHDLYYTPIGQDFPGVETHAVLVENAISGTGLRIPVWRETYVIFSVFVTALILFIFFIVFSPKWFFINILCISFLHLLISFLFFYNYGVLFPAAGPILTVFSLFSFMSLLLYSGENKKVLDGLQVVSQSRKTILNSMLEVAQASNLSTNEYIKPTKYYIYILSKYLSEKGYYPELNLSYRKLLFNCASLYDIGKVGIPDTILTKPGRLTEKEYEIVKKHAIIGKNIMENASREEKDKSFFQVIGELAYTHHERWDGKGYPQGLSGEDIPLSGRIMALVDVYNALVSECYYKKAFSHEKAKNIIMAGRGTQFDPFITDGFLELEQEFFKISKMTPDNVKDLDFSEFK